MRSVFAKSLIVAAFVAGVASPVLAHDHKTPERDNLYVSSWEVGNKTFFSHNAWHGAKNYWMAGKGKSAKKTEAKKAEAPKK